MNYTEYVSTIANLLVVPADNAEFLADVPNISENANNRIYRELDLLNTVVRDASATLTTSTRTFNLPSTLGTFVVTEQINVITPVAAASPDQGTRNALVPASKDMLDFLYPSSTGSTVPQYFAMISQSTIIVAPWPDQAYPVEVVGTIRPAPLSESVTTTLLSVYFPDMLIAASMVRGAAFLKNYGAAIDDPKMAITWEQTYQMLKEAAFTEESRKKFTEAGWSSKEPAPAATPPRT